MVYKIDKAKQMKTEFITSISYEIRTLLTGTEGWSKALKTVEHLKKKK